MKNAGSRAGFTLLELLIVVSIMSILASIATPKFAALIRKTDEGAAKGDLGAIRSALTIYFGDTDGQFPSDLAALTVNAKYLAAIPAARIPSYHADSSVVTSPQVSDGGGWAYDNGVDSGSLGTVLVNCTHTDTSGLGWTGY